MMRSKSKLNDRWEEPENAATQAKEKETIKKIVFSSERMFYTRGRCPEKNYKKKKK